MNLLSIEHLTKAFSERKLFENADFYLQEGDKAGIIGLNGAGKSTLLKIMAGTEEPDEGSVITANHVVVGYLPQHPEFDGSKTALECILEGHGEKEDLAALTVNAKTMLTQLGVTDFDRKAGILSGGQKKRLALVSVLLRDTDILLLDEPTNHLDNGMADWLEEQLKKRKKALVMVTHDRYFLDSVCNRIVEIDRGKIYSCDTNYAGYLEMRAQREEMGQAAERKRQSILRTELAFVQRGARARSTKQKARLERYEELMGRQAPVADGRLELGSVSSRLGRTTVELEKVTKGYDGRTLIKDFSYIFQKGDRVGFIGKNGCGKSTLMRLLAGRERPDSGDITIGQTVKIGYYEQAAALFDPGQRVIDCIRDVAEYVRTTEGSISASQMLERFLFEGGAQYVQTGRLSGGEKRRLNLLRVLMGAPNVLILDEPTNDLDISTLTVLEDYLDHFDGIVIIVSHDRYFLDRTVKRIFAFEGDGRLCQYEGGYSDYALRKSMEQEEALSAINGGRESVKEGRSRSTARGNWKKAPKRLKFTYKEQKEYETIEADIASLEEKLSALEEEITGSATDFVKLNRLTAEKAEAQEALEEKMERWMYLEDKAARIDAGEMEEEDE